MKMNTKSKKTFVESNCSDIQCLETVCMCMCVCVLFAIQSIVEQEILLTENSHLLFDTLEFFVLQQICSTFELLRNVM